MPLPILGPNHALAQRFKDIEAQAYTGGDLQPYVEAPSGMYVQAAWINVPHGPVSSGTGAGAHIAEWYPYYVPETVTIQTVSVNVTTAQSGWDGLRLAFYNGDITEYNLVQEFGVFDVSTTGQQAITGSWVIPKGWMWVASKLEGSGSTVPSLSRAPYWAPPTTILGAPSNQVGTAVYGHVSSQITYTDPLTGNTADPPFPPTITPAGPMTWAPLQVGVQVL